MSFHSMLVTSANSSLNWDLRCRVREALLDFMRREYPQYLPRMRAELQTQHSGDTPAGQLRAEPTPGRSLTPAAALCMR